MTHEPMDVAIMVTVSEAEELLSFLKRLELLPHLTREETMTIYWMENATSRAINAKKARG